MSQNKFRKFSCLFACSLLGLVVSLCGCDKPNSAESQRQNIAIQQQNDLKECYRQACQGNPVAQCSLGLVCIQQKNFIEANKWFLVSAQQGYAQAQYDLGISYFNGYGILQNYAEAVKWFRLAAQQGYADAQCLLGYCYYSGKGVEQDYTEAVQWYRLSAQQNNPLGQGELGRCYYFGRGVKQDYAQAVKWYQLSAQQGNPAAQCNLGECYYYGYGVNRNQSEAMNWYQKSAEQGCPDAQIALAVCMAEEYNNSTKKTNSHICSGPPIDDTLKTKSRQWIHQAIQHGFSDVIYEDADWRNQLLPWLRRAKALGFDEVTETLNSLENI